MSWLCIGLYMNASWWFVFRSSYLQNVPSIGTLISPTHPWLSGGTVTRFSICSFEWGLASHRAREPHPLQIFLYALHACLCFPPKSIDSHTFLGDKVWKPHKNKRQWQNYAKIQRQCKQVVKFTRRATDYPNIWLATQQQHHWSLWEEKEGEPPEKWRAACARMLW